MVVAKIKNKQCMKKYFAMGMEVGIGFLKIQIAIGIENKNEKIKKFICYPFFIKSVTDKITKTIIVVTKVVNPI